MRTGHADLPLHGGHAPRWLFERMTALARQASLAVVAEEGPGGLLRRLCDPVWFQAFDGTPFPVDRATYDATIESLRRAVAEARVGRAEKIQALKRLAGFSAAR